MAVTSTGVYCQTPHVTPAAFTNGDSANAKKTVTTGGADGSKVIAVLAASTDTAARIAQLWLTRSGTSYLLGSATVPITAGSDGLTATMNLLSLMPGLPIDNDGQPFLYLENGDTLQVSFTTQVTSPKEIDVVAHFGNF